MSNRLKRLVHPIARRVLLPIALASLVVAGLAQLAPFHSVIGDLSRALLPTARGDVQTAWQRARAAGAYHFTADVIQTTIPLTTLDNIGRSSKQQTMHIEGSANLPQQSLELAIGRMAAASRTTAARRRSK